MGFLFMIFLCFRVTDTTIQVSADNSTYSVASNGGKVYYLLLRKLGYKVERLGNHLLGLRENASMVIILSPQASFSEKEVAWSRDYVSSGGSLLICDDEDNEILRAFGVIPYKVSSSGGAEEVVPIPSHVTGGAQKVLLYSSTRLKFKSPPGCSKEIILVDEKGVIMAEVRRGRGRIIVSSAPEVFSNDLLKKADNSLLAVNCVSTFYGGKPVYIDEYHHGFRDRESIFQSAGEPAKYLLFQILCLVFFVFHAAGKQFQTPLPFMSEEKRHAKDFVNAMAALYQRAEARAGALSILYKNCRKNMARSLGLSLEIDNEQLARLYTAGSCAEESELRQTLVNCEKIIKTGVVDNEGLLTLARKLHYYERGEPYE
jgi:hypothetical protein